MLNKAKYYMKHFFFILLFILSSITIKAQSGEYHVRKSLPMKHRSNFIEINTNNFLLVDYNDYNLDSTICYIVDSNLEVLDTIIIEERYAESFPSIFEAKSKGVFLLYYTYENLTNSLKGNDINASLIKLDKDGNVLWKKKYGGNSYDQLYQLKEGKEGIIYLSGITYSGVSPFKNSSTYGEEDIWVLKLDSLGNQIWDYTFGGNEREKPNLIMEYFNKDVLVVGVSGSDSNGSRTFPNPCGSLFTCESVLMIKIDSQGNLKEEKYYYKQDYTDYPSDAIESFNKSAIIHISEYQSNDADELLVKIDSNLNVVWTKKILFSGGGFNFEQHSKGRILSYNKDYKFIIHRIDKDGNDVWVQELLWRDSIPTGRWGNYAFNTLFKNNSFYITSWSNFKNEQEVVSIYDTSALVLLQNAKNKITGKVFPDLNSDCKIDINEPNIANNVIYNQVENSYGYSDDSIYTIYNFDSDSAILKVVNLDTFQYVSCNTDSIILSLPNMGDTSNINFPIQTTMRGHCLKINSFSHSLLRPGRWSTYSLNYQNNAFDTAYIAFIEIEIDTSKIDSISSSLAYTQVGTKLVFQLGNSTPFMNKKISFSIKLKTSVVIGTAICHRANIYPKCQLYKNPSYDNTVLLPSISCSNNSINLKISNTSNFNQNNWSTMTILENDRVISNDSFKLNANSNKEFTYSISDNSVFTSIIATNNNQSSPILIRHNDICALKEPIKSDNPILNFSRYDQSVDYEEDCDIVRGSYDPNIKSVFPIGFTDNHYTSNGTELKYRIDFQNTGTDTAFKVVIRDELNDNLDISTFESGVSSHDYKIEFDKRELSFVFENINLVDSNQNEPLSHGYVTFKIKPNNNLSPKTLIQNTAKIYFDFNAPIFTNTTFNSIFDTIVVSSFSSSNIEVNKNSILVFPNPTSDYIHIHSDIKDRFSVQLISINGKIIKTLESENNQNIKMNVQDIEHGIYFIRTLSNDEFLDIRKVLIQ